MAPRTLRAGVVWSLRPLPIWPGMPPPLPGLGVTIPWCRREGAGTWWQDMFQRGLLNSEGRGQGWGSVSGQQETLTFAGDGGGALLRQAPHPQAVPQCLPTQELGTERSEVRPRGVPCSTPLEADHSYLKAFQVQGLVGRLLGMAW